MIVTGVTVAPIAAIARPDAGHLVPRACWSGPWSS